MNIVHQYYNEIVLAFNSYDTDLRDGMIVIYVANDGKPFDTVCNKIHLQIQKIEEMLEERSREVVIRVQRSDQFKEIRLPQVSSEE